MNTTRKASVASPVYSSHATLVDVLCETHTDVAIFQQNLTRHLRCSSRIVDSPKRLVYVLRSISDPTRYYTGITSNVKARLTAHNAGECVHSSRHRPWELDLVIAFRDQPRALQFERYLKSGSGLAFAQRHLRGS